MTTKIARTGTTPTNTTKYTWSAWIKRGALGNGETIVYNYQDGNNRGYIAFDGNDKMFFYDKTGSEQNNCYATRLFRDTGAWYHVHVKADSTLASNRFVVHINGVQEAITGTTIDQNDVLGFKTATGSNQHSIGANADSTANPFSGAMSHIHYVDGLALDYTEFGQTDSTTGEWKIKTPNVSDYGNNGYFILKDGDSVTDQSGKGNNFTVTNGTLTKTEDNPSNNFCTLNMNVANAGYALANGNTTFLGQNEVDWKYGVVGHIGANSGKWYWEIKWTSGDSYSILGVLPTSMIHRCNKSDTGTDIYMKINGNQFSTSGSGGTKYNYSASDGSDPQRSLNDIFMYAIDFDNKKMWLGENGVWDNSGNPATGANPGWDTSEFSSSAWDEGFVPFVQSYKISAVTTFQFNFGNGYFGTTAVSSAGTNASNLGIFEYDVPSGYTALCTKGLNL